MNKREPIVVKGRQIGQGAPIFLTAEIGVAHQGSYTAAKKLMLGAKEAGCDGADMFVASAYDYFWADSGIFEEDDRKVWEHESLTREEWRTLFDYADEIGLILYLTPLDLPSIRLAGELGSPMVNINSDDVNNPLHLEELAKLGVPVTMHDINVTLAEVEGAVKVLRDNGCSQIIILHSTQETGDDEYGYATANLRVMDTYKAAFGRLGVEVGCVEHTTSDFLIYTVVAREPVLISKHILLAHGENVPDNSISVDISNLASMVRKVRYSEMSLGIGSNVLVTDDEGNMSEWDSLRRKVLVAVRDLPAGHKVQKGDIIAKRPGNKGGIHPWHVYELTGATTTAAIKADTPVSLSMFKDFQASAYKFPALDEARYSARRESA